ncbi:MAG TPA: GNAT family N-acetyltransferase [Thermoplasmata archaeon]|nr:GNAT family N-acetyltransferase [Thermoplasmata archaeon]
MEIEVRPGRSQDLPAILEVYNHYVERSPATFEVSPVHPSERAGWVHEHLAGGRYRLWVAVDREPGNLVGWATTSPFRPRAAYVTTVESSVYCRAGSEGHGVGSRLYTALFRSIRNEDIERVVAAVTLPNPASVRLHRRFGFRRVGTFHRVGRKFDRFWDVAWFERPLRIPNGPQVPAA